MNKNEAPVAAGRDRLAVLLALFFMLSFAAGIVILLKRPAVRGGDGLEQSGPGIGVVSIRGAIMTSRQGGFGIPREGSQAVIDAIQRLGDSPLVRGLVVRIDSPGGAVAASQELYEALRRFRKGGRPVVVSFGDVAASGGYYVACAADKIVSNPGTTTGSIGVIMVAPDMKGLYDWVRIQWNVIKSGQFKDILSPYRAMTAAERIQLQNLVGDAYEQFFEVVHRGRQIPRERLLTLAQGQVFTGRQAQKLGLVDELGDYEHALLLAGQLAKLPGRPREIRIREKTGLADIFGALGGLSRPGISLLPPVAPDPDKGWGPGIYYLYRGL